MHVKNLNFAIFLILAVAVGFGLGFLFGGISVQSDLSGGDISKASRYSAQKEDPALSVIEDRLRNDEEFFNSTKGAMDLLQNRMTALSELTEKTMEVCSGIPEFQPMMTELQSMNAKAFNTSLALTNANAGLEKMAAGKLAPDYELYSNQAYIGFSKVESQMDLGKRVYDVSSAYLAGKRGDQYKPLADIAVVWSVYCTQDAYMNGSNKDIEYWKNKYSELDGVGGSEIRAQLEKALAQASKAQLKAGIQDNFENLLQDAQVLNKVMLLGSGTEIESLKGHITIIYNGSVLEAAFPGLTDLGERLPIE